MKLPPRIVRRILIAPALLLLTIVVVTTVPIWALGAAAISPLVPGRFRPLRLLWLFVIYLVAESIGIIACFVMWLASGFGLAFRTETYRSLHYGLLKWLVMFGYRNAVWVLKISIDIDQVDEHDMSPVDSVRPLLVFCRHAGPGDSFFLLHEVMTTLERRPLIVLKDFLQFDPVLDTILNRLPNSFIPSDADAAKRMVASIETLAENMDERDALVLFPEGGNFTPKRRVKAIERLRRLGHADEAATAESMSRVLPPRPGGALAAIAANPATDILLIAHTGLEHMSSLADMWRGLPMDTPVKAAWWLEPEEDVPVDPDARIDWLFEKWKEIDSWIQANDPIEMASMGEPPSARRMRG
jgi:1-acyl-sn-glycerol-3-phosphate acyltransferase